MSEASNTHPIPQSTKEALEKALNRRSEREELIERNILPSSNVAPALQAAQKALERSQLENSLEHKLQKRPTAAELVKEGILEKDEVPPS
ncbi:SubName: Full=Uncharacterized protein {ECO:0000313/EMBL:CCA66339.1} [Serendipita indica DSM 11827]|uniref:RPEL repeat protein n=1 Tax=Serendipita indica (strain DSM 11827) TaxID=1109443 RepID=G4T4U3_SERID|nr:SubName: Full=Uncharacterized protein {ECO:0000313/EMBL:CCA66339.1} [Serendipita indica DSM 11827]CCA66339.1 hypothetical protein PIIN_00025 [Serendipita indica DSM 11827]